MSAQLGFDVLLAQADASNKERQNTKAYAHLPDTMDKALPFYRDLINTHHLAMVDGDITKVMQLRSDAHDLACKLNNFEPGIVADEDSPGCVLDRLTRAPQGDVPLWGQSGSFVVTIGTLRVRIDMDGIFGICGLHTSWMGFGAQAVDLGKPFISETGFRSFLGAGGALRPGFTPDRFAAAIIEAYVATDCRGKLVLVRPKWRQRT